jgi:hypothetical protein
LQSQRRPEFEDDKFRAVEAPSPLSEYDWTGAIKLDGDNNQQNNRQKN